MTPKPEDKPHVPSAPESEPGLAVVVDRTEPDRPGPPDTKREPKGLVARNRRIGRPCHRKGRPERVCVGKDWSHDGFGRPVRVGSPEDGEPAPDGSQTPACHDVMEEQHAYDLKDLSPDGSKIRMLVLRFGHEGALAMHEDVPTGFPFRFSVKDGVLRLRPAPAVPYDLEVVCEGDTLPAPPEPETQPALPEDS